MLKPQDPRVVVCTHIKQMIHETRKDYEKLLVKGFESQKRLGSNRPLGRQGPLAPPGRPCKRVGMAFRPKQCGKGHRTLPDSFFNASTQTQIQMSHKKTCVFFLKLLACTLRGYRVIQFSSMQWFADFADSFSRGCPAGGRLLRNKIWNAKQLWIEMSISCKQKIKQEIQSISPIFHWTGTRSNLPKQMLQIQNRYPDILKLEIHDRWTDHDG